MRAHSKRWIFPAALLIGAVACVVPDKVPSYQPAWEPFDPEEEGWITTRPVQLVSDCQFHNLYSEAVPERNLSAEAAVSTAIRPPQLDLFSPDVLSWILENGSPETEAILFMGDALDLACEGEFEAFAEVMGGAGKPWLMAPGNHDTYYFGVFHPQRTELWEDACYGSGKPLDKASFIRIYVAALLRQDDPGFTALAEAMQFQNVRDMPLTALAQLVPPTFEWRADVDAPGFLDGISWVIDDERPWRSYILQSADVSGTHERIVGAGVHALMLDSCQYARAPEFLPNAWASYPVKLNSGSAGDMQPNQLRKVRSWIEENREGTGFVLMCHHNFDSLAPRAKSSLGWLWRERNVSVMVTGHTHKGFFMHHDLGGDGDELELNLASTTDWPMEWRTLVGYAHPEKEELYIRTDRHTLVDELTNREGFFLQGWEVPLDAPDDYRKYKQGTGASGKLLDIYYAYSIVPYWMPQPRVKAGRPARHTEEQVKDTLLWTYVRLIENFPTNSEAGQPTWPEGCATDTAVLDRIMALAAQEDVLTLKSDLLAELAAFERSRTTWDPETSEPTDDVRRRFKISQAAWASRFENSKGRQLSVEDELIRVDWDKALRRRNNQPAKSSPKE